MKQRKKNLEIDGLLALDKRLRKGDKDRLKIEERLYNLQAGFGDAILHDVTLC
ncbi:hypothetical protein [Sporosarcina koreensis]|uniref:hypothetical protein n=1 Tax=Sporosarcina koreensis TaxID=334735 RepID=UPI0013658E27|nr:hypothetical protein [Sporosarcina koreensis]